MTGVILVNLIFHFSSFRVSAVHDFFSGEIFIFFFISFSVSEFAGFRICWCQKHICVCICKKTNKNFLVPLTRGKNSYSAETRNWKRHPFFL